MARLYHIYNVLWAQSALLFALGSQYIFGLYPCELCVIQRIPYVAVVILSIGGVFFAHRKRLIGAANVMILSFLAYLSTASVALYHVATEQHWVDGPSGCTTGDGAGLSNDQILQQIMSAPTAFCDDISFMFMGLSMAGWNAVWAIFCMGYSLWARKRIVALQAVSKNQGE